MLTSPLVAKAVLDALPETAAVLDPDTTIVMVNRAWRTFSERNGGHGEEHIGTRYLDVCDAAAMTAVVQAASGVRAEHLYPCHAPERPRWYRMVASPMEDGHILVMHHEVTDEIRLRRRMDTLNIAFVDTNGWGEAVEVSGRWRRLTGAARRDAMGLGWLDCFRPDDAEHLLGRLRHRPEGRQRADTLTLVLPLAAEDRWLELTCAPDLDGAEWIGWRIAADDVTDQVWEKVGAETDPLTEVLNRRGLDRRIADRWADVAGLGIVFIDLDDFKQVNDIHGHVAGDAVLVAVGERLRHVIRRDDEVGRYGGDEFTIVAPGIDVSDLASYAERIEATLDSPVLFGGVPISVRASAGWAHGRDGETMDELLQRADAAMYERKAARRAR